MEKDVVSVNSRNPYGFVNSYLCNTKLQISISNLHIWRWPDLSKQFFNPFRLVNVAIHSGT